MDGVARIKVEDGRMDRVDQKSGLNLEKFEVCKWEIKKSGRVHDWMNGVTSRQADRQALSGWVGLCVGCVCDWKHLREDTSTHHHHHYSLSLSFYPSSSPPPFVLAPCVCVCVGSLWARRQPPPLICSAVCICLVKGRLKRSHISRRGRRNSRLSCRSFV